MGSVYQKENGKWAGYAVLPSIPGKKRNRQYIPALPSKSAALQAVEELEAMAKLGLLNLNTSAVTVGDVVDYWYRQHCLPKLKPTTINNYLGYIEGKDYIPRISGLAVSDLKAAHIRTFYNKLHEEGKGNSSLTYLHAVLRSAFNYAEQDDLIDQNVMKKVKVESYSSPDLDDSGNYFHPTLVDCILDHLKEKDSPIYFNAYFSFKYGLREAETAALHIDDVDFEGKSIVIRHSLKRCYGKNGIIGKNYIRKLDKNTVLMTRKNKKTLILPLTPEAEAIIRQQILWIKRNQKWYSKTYDHRYDGFLSVSQDGHIRSDKYISSRWKDHEIDSINSYLESNEHTVKKVTFHGLRHSCATYLIYIGVDLITIKDILGHSQFSVTSDTYAHVMTDKKREALEKLSKPINQ